MTYSNSIRETLNIKDKNIIFSSNQFKCADKTIKGITYQVFEAQLTYSPKACEKWESQKEYVREKLSDEKTGAIYRKRKTDVEPFFGFLKANLGFTRLSLRGQSKAHNELGFALLAVNLRKLTANNVKNPLNPNDDKNKNGSIYDKTVNRTIFYLVRLVMSQPLF